MHFTQIKVTARPAAAGDGPGPGAGHATEPAPGAADHPIGGLTSMLDSPCHSDTASSTKAAGLQRSDRPILHVLDHLVGDPGRIPSIDHAGRVFSTLAQAATAVQFFRFNRPQADA
jgi:hypothetical protein